VLAASGGYGLALPELGPADFREIAEKTVAGVISALSPASDVRVRPRVVRAVPDGAAAGQNAGYGSD
jgi:hypothetical protein